MTTDITADHARSLDMADPLSQYRDLIFNGDPSMVYMDGNSLGRLPIKSIENAENVVKEQWGNALIRSWGDQWFDAPIRIGDKIAKLIGASEGEVAVSDSTTVNLYKLAMSAIWLNASRKKIITDDLNFPSDLYMLQGCNYFLGNSRQLIVAHAKDGMKITTQQMIDLIDEDTALVTLSHVVFKSGYMYDVKAITEHAHKKGALVLWDLSHAVGAVKVALNEWNVDFAVGCTYKYLNGGPGSPAFLYVRKDLQEKALSPIWGWFGDTAPFSFDLKYRPAANIRRFLTGTPPVLSMQTMETGVDLMLEVGMDRLREKSEQLSTYMIALFDKRLAPLGFALGSPRETTSRGSHISFKHPEGYRINRSLIEDMNVIPDFREPDNIRLGLTPLYTSYLDVWECVDRIVRVVSGKHYEKFPVDRLTVT